MLDALEEEKAKVNPLDHKVARALLPEYLDQLAALEAEVAELDSTIKAATASEDDEVDAEPSEDALSPAEIKKLKTKLTATRKQLKAEKSAFAHRLAKASEALDDSSARRIVLNAMRARSGRRGPGPDYPASPHRDRGLRDVVGQVPNPALSA